MAAPMLLLPGVAHALVEALTPADQLQLGTVFPGDPNPQGSAPWVVATLSNTSTGDFVGITLQATGIPAGEEVTQVFLNLNPAINPSQLAFVAAGGLAPISIHSGPVVTAAGGGNYNIVLNFATSGAGKFIAGKQTLIEVQAPGPIYASDLLYPSTGVGAEGNYYAAAQLQNVPGSGVTTWVGAPFYSPIPEPAPLAACLGIAALGAVVLRRRNAAAVAWPV